MKRYCCFALAIVFIIMLFTGCSVDGGSYTQESSEPTDYAALIDTATTVKIEEAFFSLVKKYNVYVDGQYVASVTGQYINITGDVFTLTDANGKIIAKEKQIKRWGVRLNRLANLMDKDGNTTGYIGDEYFNDFFSLSKYNFHIYDSNKNELGYTKEQIFSLLY